MSARRTLAQARTAATTMQAAWRALSARRAVAAALRLRAAETLQARWRARQARAGFATELLRLRAAAVVQRIWRWHRDGSSSGGGGKAATAFREVVILAVAAQHASLVLQAMWRAKVGPISPHNCSVCTLLLASGLCSTATSGSLLALHVSTMQEFVEAHYPTPPLLLRLQAARATLVRLQAQAHRERFLARIQMFQQGGAKPASAVATGASPGAGSSSNAAGGTCGGDVGKPAGKATTRRWPTVGGSSASVSMSSAGATTAAAGKGAAVSATTGTASYPAVAASAEQVAATETRGAVPLAAVATAAAAKAAAVSSEIPSAGDDGGAGTCTTPAAVDADSGTAVSSAVEERPSSTILRPSSVAAAAQLDFKLTPLLELWQARAGQQQVRAPWLGFRHELLQALLGFQLVLTAG